LIRKGWSLTEIFFECCPVFGHRIEPTNARLLIEGIDAAPRRRGYPSVENLKAGKKR
jgi:hypothetical protein